MERRLLNYYPEVLKAFREIRVIADVEQPEVDGLWRCLDDTLNDQFVTTATDHGIQRWEKILGIIPKATATAEERRFLILIRLSEELPYSMGMLKQQMSALCGVNGYTVELKNREYTLIVRVALTVRNNFSDVDEMLRRMVPANLAVDLSLLYNQHKTLMPFTHGHLNGLTYYGLRNEVEIDGN